MDNAPEVVELGRTFMCTYCACESRSRLATHTVDGTSVCRAHVAEAIAWAQSKRAVQVRCTPVALPRIPVGGLG